MTLSLSQLFQQSQSSQSPSIPKQEEVDSEHRSNNHGPTTKRFKNDPEQSAADTDRGDGSASNKEQRDGKTPEAKPVRIKTETPGGTKRKIKEETIDEVVKNDANDDSGNHREEYEDEEDGGERDDVVDLSGTDAFYENYPQTARALYRFQDTKRDNKESQPSDGHGGDESQADALGAIHSALFPAKSKKALAMGNGRRLSGAFEDENHPSRSLTGRLRPRQKRVRVEGPSGKKEVSLRLETQEEVNERVQKMERWEEKIMQRVRWKRRLVNFQAEDDVGNAFLARAEQDLGEGLRADLKERRSEEQRKREKLRKKREKEERNRLRELERNDHLEEDDELKEQSQLLAQLTQQSDLVPNEDDKESGKGDGAPSSAAFLEELDYWEKGYTYPERSLISYNLHRSVKKMVQGAPKTFSGARGKTAQHDAAGETDDKKTSLGSLMNEQFGVHKSYRFFFEPNKTSVTTANKTVRPGFRSGHVRHMVSMAVRSLCGGGGGVGVSRDDIALENHYIRLLCMRAFNKDDADTAVNPTICAEFRTRGYLAAASLEQGSNMLLYLQNTWDDPAKVARKLGILDCYQDSPIKGNLLKHIRKHSKNLRSKIKRSHRISSADWCSDNNDYEADHDLDEGSSATPEDKVTPEITTSGGVADAVTTETCLTIDKEKAINLSKNDRDALISPNSLYSHIAGTSPPIPQHPLDPSSCLFGPVDRHSKFHHIGVKMDSAISKVMLSTLMKRVGRARITSNEPLSINTSKQILDLVQEFADVNENKLYLRYTNYIQDPNDSDIPLVEFYRGLAEYCSFMANGYLEVNHSNTRPAEVQQTHDEREDFVTQASGMSLLAEKIWEFCRPKIHQNALIRFPKLKITYGVALVCRSLPSSAAEILSRPTDDDGFCTPLNLFKQTLEDLETKKYISCTSDRHFDDSDAIRAVELEFLLHDAAELFHEAVKLDPINVDYQMWHIGCLASCLLVSSGNKISDNVHIYPSQKKGSFMNQYIANHEVRCRLKKYHEVRIELSNAIRVLFTLAKYQNSAKVHLAVYSLLEWGQVIGLLVGNVLDQFLQEINSLHAFHFKEWARRDPVAFLRQNQSKDRDFSDVPLYAQILESDPEDIRNWRNFVQCLGHVPKTKKDDPGWWGEDRSWWGDSLLHLFTPEAVDRALINGDLHAVEIVITKLENVGHHLSIPPDHLPLTKSELDTEHRNGINCESFEWLPTHDSIMDQINKNVDDSKVVRSKCFAGSLPRKNGNFSETERVGSDRGSPVSIHSCESSVPLPEFVSLSEEAQAYKIFIACHLFGLDHPPIRQCMYHNLFRKCYKFENPEAVNENCDEFRTLAWFLSLGMNLSEIMRSRF